MIQRVDLKTPYNSRYRTKNGNLSEKTLYGVTNLNKNENINKPLNDGANAWISFRGLSLAQSKGLFKPIIKKVPQNLTEKVFQSLEKVSDAQLAHYTKVREEYVNLVKTSKEFREKFGFSEEVAKNISVDNLYYKPKKKFLAGFLSNLVSPFVEGAKAVKKLFNTQQSDTHSQIMKDFTSLEGLLKSHEIWENGYRKMSGNSQWNEAADFIIPDDVLLNKIKRRRNKVVDPDKGKYSTSSLMIGNRFISGVVYAYFLGNDAYNTTMRYSNDKTEAAGQRKSRVSQEFSRIGLNMYIQNVLFRSFETAVNKSLPTALFVSGSTVACSEILGRKLVGKPIMPSDKETLDRLEQEMENKKGILPSLGRLLTRVKKIPKTDKSQSGYKPTKANIEAFSGFSSRKSQTDSTSLSHSASHSHSPSFKGFFKVEKMFDKQKISELVKMLEIADKKQADYIKQNIVKSVKGSKFLENITRSATESYSKEVVLYDFIKNSSKIKKTELDKSFEYIMEAEDITNIPLGKRKTVLGQLTKSLMVPFTFVKNVFISAKDAAKNMYLRFSNKQHSSKIRKMETCLKNSTIQEINDFEQFYNKRLKLQAWSGSNLAPSEKKARILEEYLEILEKEPEEIEGVKNILLWLDKQITKSGIKLNENGTLDEKDIKKIQEIMKDSALKADGAQQVEYDGNKLAQSNINLARAITTLFLVTDAYNLTMQYSNDNKKDANKSAKNRAAQEISRIGFSAYILAFVHNLLSKLCNSSLAGAFGLTAMTSVINDSISRKVVGVPLTAKTQEELLQIDEENSTSISPIKKALAYSMGKKNPASQTVETKKTSQNYFANDFWINPTIS